MTPELVYNTYWPFGISIPLFACFPLSSCWILRSPTPLAISYVSDSLKPTRDPDSFHWTSTRGLVVVLDMRMAAVQTRSRHVHAACTTYFDAQNPPIVAVVTATNVGQSSRLLCTKIGIVHISCFGHWFLQDRSWNNWLFWHQCGGVIDSLSSTGWPQAWRKTDSQGVRRERYPETVLKPRRTWDCQCTGDTTSSCLFAGRVVWRATVGPSSLSRPSAHKGVFFDWRQFTPTTFW